MKKKLLILAPVLLVVSHIMYSQNTAGSLMIDLRMLADRNAAGGLKYEDISGSPYYSDEFREGTVNLKNGNRYIVPLRYDLYQDEIEFKQAGSIYWLTKNDVEDIHLGQEVLYPENSNYYFVLDSGRFSLCIKKRVSFFPKVPPKAYADEIPDRFERDRDEYFLKQENNPPEAIKNKKTLLGIFSENQAALDFIKTSKINVNKVEDLLELVRFLNNQPMQIQSQD